jgi:hypothetical protein
MASARPGSILRQRFTQSPSAEPMTTPLFLSCDELIITIIATAIIICSSFNPLSLSLLLSMSIGSVSLSINQAISSINNQNQNQNPPQKNKKLNGSIVVTSRNISVRGRKKNKKNTIVKLRKCR